MDRVCRTKKANSRPSQCEGHVHRPGIVRQYAGCAFNERERFAKTFSDNGCLFQLGCLGPNTKADCTLRSWNSGVNSCIRAGAPCVGCASELFAAKKSLAFYPREELAATARRKLEESAL